MMTPASGSFSVVWRGYEKAQVDRMLADVGSQLEEAGRRDATLVARVSELDRRCEELASAAEDGSYPGLGPRIEKMRTLAVEEEKQGRRRATEDATSLQAESHEAAKQVQAQADAYAAERRAASDVHRAEQVRVDADQHGSEAEREAAAHLDDAQRRADDVLAHARAAADPVRAESDRELAAATLRRDGINAQLTNVRQMVATLTGATSRNPSTIDDESPKVIALRDLSEQIPAPDSTAQSCVGDHIKEKARSHDTSR